MKKKSPLMPMLAMVLITLSMLITFNERIASKPTDAGFWLILAFGMSVGVALTGILINIKQKKG